VHALTIGRFILQQLRAFAVLGPAKRVPLFSPSTASSLALLMEPRRMAIGVAAAKVNDKTPWGQMIKNG